MTMIFADDAAELKHYRARDRRNAARRARRTRGGDYVAQQRRQADHAALYAAAGTVSLAELDRVAKMHQHQVDQAVIRLVTDDHYSWAMIGAELGVSKQAAQQRFGRLVKSSRRPGAQPAELR